MAMVSPAFYVGEDSNAQRLASPSGGRQSEGPPPPDVTQAILDCLELPSRAPPTAAAFPDPDPDSVDEWPGDFEATL
jgi:hypothetical protein